MEEIREENKKFMNFNENENTTRQNLWDIAKAFLKRKFIVMNAYIKNTEISQINTIKLHLNILENKN
jgi:hypothetical protein